MQAPHVVGEGDLGLHLLVESRAALALGGARVHHAARVGQRLALHAAVLRRAQEGQVSRAACD